MSVENASDTNSNSVVLLLNQIKAGDNDAIAALWERYYPALSRLANQKLKAAPHCVDDGSAVALSAIHSFCQAAQKDRFPDLTDHEGLFRLLFTMTARKAVDRIRHAHAQIRGGGVLKGEAALGIDDSCAAAIDQVADRVPPPEMLAIMDETLERLLAQLDDDQMRTFARDRIQGYSNEEIAQRHNCSLRTVERRMSLIRRKWKRELTEE